MRQNRYSIAEASEILGYKPHVIRYYEKEFNIKIPRNNANHRYFTENEILAFKQIKELQERGYNNTQIKMIMKSPVDYTNQLYAQLEGVVATAFDINPFSDEAFRVMIQQAIENSKNEIIGELKKQLDTINENLVTTISELIKALEEERE